METEGSEAPDPLPLTFSESGSEYETTSSSEGDEEATKSRPSSAGRSPTEKPSSKTIQSSISSSKLKRRADGENPSHARERIETPTAEAASEWAANFQPPQSPREIKSPSRQTPGSRAKAKKTAKPPSEARAKRLKSFYSDDYRELLNVEIQDASVRMLRGDFEPVTQSQIGSSIWTAMEKDIFFSALSRLGRDNVRGIANRITTKSEVEVQQYIQLLQANLVERNPGVLQKRLSAPHEFSAAKEISEECCAVLERAGQALWVRQELAEEQIEKNKWGDSWLLTESVSRWLEERRREKGGEEEMEEVLPAVNLLDLQNWLKLSHDIFMNPGLPHQEDNWENLAEPGETPAIRATAFEDFHSLAVSITKRLVSTTIFCTMSRLRARSSKIRKKTVKAKYADVEASDIEAAVNILGLKNDSEQFWITAARRRHLQVVDTETKYNDASDDNTQSPMAYDEVEEILSSLKRARPRSRSRNPSRRPRSISSHSSIHGTSTPEGELGFDDSDSMSEPFDEELDLIDFDASHTKESKRLQAQLSLQEAHDAFIDVCDMQESHEEEVRLWDLLHQTAPFAIKAEPVHEEDRPKTRNSKPGVTSDWRDHTEFWSEWEMIKTPIREEEFERNRVRTSKKRKWIESLGDGGQDGALSKELVVESDDEVEEEVLEEAGRHQNNGDKDEDEDSLVGDEDGPDGGDGSELDSAAGPSIRALFSEDDDISNR